VLSIETFCFRRSGDELGAPLTSVTRIQETLQPGADGAMISGDRNLSHGVWNIEYRIADGEAFVRHVGESLEAVRAPLQRVAETQIMREVASRRFEDVTRGDVASLAAAVRDRLRAEAQRLNLGVEIVSVTADTVEPLSVRSAYTMVGESENEKKRLEDEARQLATQILNEAAGAQHAQLLEHIREYGARQALEPDPDAVAAARQRIDAAVAAAGGQVAAQLRDAGAQAAETYERIRSEFELFRFLSERYREHPQITQLEMWNMMREAVLGSAREVFYVPRSNRLDILINRDPDRALEEELRRFQQSRPR
jgi:regulator of protease activity HflC (stomatin/prohibitin superfamily)